jgi:hypothetical protein
MEEVLGLIFSTLDLQEKTNNGVSKNSNFFITAQK